MVEGEKVREERRETVREKRGAEREDRGRQEREKISE